MAMGDRMRPRLWLLMATYGRQHEPLEFMRSLGPAMDQSPFAVSLVVIEQNDPALFRERPDVLDDGVDYHWIWSEPGLSRARNAGLRTIHGLGAAEGDVTAFPDDDCRYLASTISTLWEVHARHPEAAVWTGTSVDATGKANMADWLSKPAWVRPHQVFRAGISITIFARYPAVDSIGGFDPSLGAGSCGPWGSGEETDLLLRVMARDGRVRFEPCLRVHHPTKPLDPDRVDGYAMGLGFVAGRHALGYRAWIRMLGRPLAGALLALAQADVGLARLRLAVAAGRWRGHRRGVEDRVERA